MGFIQQQDDWGTSAKRLTMNSYACNCGAKIKTQLSTWGEQYNLNIMFSGKVERM